MSQCSDILIPRGPWNATDQYYPNDWVAHNNAAWIASVAIDPNNEPTSSSTLWMPLATALVTGPRGLTGIKGDYTRPVYARAATQPSAPTGTWDGTNLTVNPPWHTNIPGGPGLLWRADALIDNSNNSVTFTDVYRWTGPTGPQPTDARLNTLIGQVVTNLDLQSGADVTTAIQTYLTTNEYVTRTQVEEIVNEAYQNVLIELGTLQVEYSLDGNVWRPDLTLYTMARVRLNNPDAEWIIINFGQVSSGSLGQTVIIEFSSQANPDKTDDNDWHAPPQLPADTFVAITVGTGDRSDPVELASGGMVITGLPITVQFSSQANPDKTDDNDWHDPPELSTDTHVALRAGDGSRSDPIALGSGGMPTPTGNNLANYSDTTTYSAGDWAWFVSGTDFSGVVVSRTDNNVGNMPAVRERTAHWDILSGSDISQIEEFFAAEDRLPDASNSWRIASGTTAGVDGIIEPNPTARWYASIADIPQNRQHLHKWRVLLHSKNYGQVVAVETPTPVLNPDEVQQTRAEIERTFPVEPIVVDNFSNYAGYAFTRSINGEENVNLVDLSFYDSSGTALESNVVFQSNSIGRLSLDEIGARASRLRTTNNTTGRISVRVTGVYAEIEGSLTHSPTKMSVSGTGYLEVAYSQTHTHIEWTTLSPSGEPGVRMIGPVRLTEASTANSSTQGIIVVARLEPTTGTTPELVAGNIGTHGPKVTARDAHGVRFNSQPYSTPIPSTNFDTLDVDDIFILGYTQDNLAVDSSKWQFFANNSIYKTATTGAQVTSPIVVDGAYADLWAIFWTDTLSTEAKDNFSTQIIKEPFGDGLYGAINKKAFLSNERGATGRAGLPPVYRTTSATFTTAGNTDARGEAHWINSDTDGDLNYFASTADQDYVLSMQVGDIFVARINHNNYCIARITQIDERDTSTGQLEVDFDVIELVGYVNGRAGETIHLDWSRPEQGTDGQTGPQGRYGLPALYETVSATFHTSQTVTARGFAHWINDSSIGNFVVRVQSADQDYAFMTEVGDIIVGRIDHNNYCIVRVTDTNNDSTTGQLYCAFSVISLVGYVNGRSGQTIHFDFSRPEQGEPGDDGEVGRPAVNTTLSLEYTTGTSPSANQIYFDPNGNNVIVNSTNTGFPANYLASLPDDTPIILQEGTTPTRQVGRVVSKSTSGDLVTLTMHWDERIGTPSTGDTLNISFGYAPAGVQGRPGKPSIGFSVSKTYAASNAVTAQQIFVDRTQRLIVLNTDGLTTDQTNRINNMPDFTPISISTLDNQKSLIVRGGPSVTDLSGNRIAIGYHTSVIESLGTFATNDSLTIGFGDGGETVLLQYSADLTTWTDSRQSNSLYYRWIIAGVISDVFLLNVADALIGPRASRSTAGSFAIAGRGVDWDHQARWSFANDPHWQVNGRDVTFVGSTARLTTQGIVGGNNLLEIANPRPGSPTFTVTDVEVFVEHLPPAADGDTPISRLKILEMSVDTLVMNAYAKRDVPLRDSTGGTVSFSGGQRWRITADITTSNPDPNNHIQLYGNNLQYSVSGSFTSDPIRLLLDNQYVVSSNPNLESSQQTKRLIDTVTGNYQFDSKGLIGEARVVPQVTAAISVSRQIEWQFSTQWPSLPDTFTVEGHIISNENGVAEFIFTDIQRDSSNLRGYNQGTSTYTLTDLNVSVSKLPADSMTPIETIQIGQLGVTQESFSGGASTDVVVSTTPGLKRVELQEGERLRLEITPTPANDDFHISGMNLMLPFLLNVVLPEAQLDIEGDEVRIKDGDKDFTAALNIAEPRLIIPAPPDRLIYYVRDQTRRVPINIISNALSIDVSEDGHAIPFNEAPNEIHFGANEDMAQQVNEDDVLHSVDGFSTFSGKGNQTGVFTFEEGMYDITSHLAVVGDNDTYANCSFNVSTLNGISIGSHNWRGGTRGPDGRYYVLHHQIQPVQTRVYIYEEDGTAVANYNMYVQNHDPQAIAVTEDRIWLIGTQLIQLNTWARAFSLGGVRHSSEDRNIESQIGDANAAEYHNGRILVLHAAGSRTGHIYTFSSNFRTAYERINLPNTLNGTGVWRGVAVLDDNIVCVDFDSTRTVRAFNFSGTEITNHPYRFTVTGSASDLTTRPEDDALLILDGGNNRFDAYRDGVIHTVDDALDLDVSKTETPAGSTGIAHLNLEVPNFEPVSGQQYYIYSNLGTNQDFSVAGWLMISKLK